MALVSPRSVHVDQPLTDFSVGFMQTAEQFVAWRVFPNIPVSKQSDRYWNFPRQYFFTEGFREAAPGAAAGEVTYEVDATPTYFCRVFKERTAILHQTRANADAAVDPATLATKLLTEHALVHLERAWVTKFFSSGLWTTERAGIASGTPSGSQIVQWDNYTDSDPLADVEALKIRQLELTAKEPNKMVLGRRAWGRLKNHPDIVDRIKYGQTPGSPARVTRQAVAQLMELEEILVTSSVHNTAKQGKTPSYSFIGGNHALLVYAPGVIGQGQEVSGVKFSWDMEAPGTNEQGGAIRTWTSDETETEYAEMKMAYDFKLVSPDLGIFLNGVVAS